MVPVRIRLGAVRIVGHCGMAAAARLGARPAVRGGRRVAKAARRAVQTRAASFYDFKVGALGGGTRDSPVDGAVMDLGAYKGKVVMVQNVATI